MLTETYKAFFKENGYVVVPDIIAPQQLNELRAMTDKVLDGSIRPDLAEPDSGVTRDDFAIPWEPAIENDLAIPRRDKVRVAFHLCHTHTFFRDHATRLEIVGIARALVGSQVRLYTDQLFVKPAHHGSEVPYHQDHAYWTALKPYNMLSCWLALDDATIENGCVHMLPGTHQRLIEHREFKGPQSLGLLPEDVDAARETPVEIKAGSAMFHHSLTVHRSFPNRNDIGRRGLVTIYTPEDIRFAASWPFTYGFRKINGRRLEEPDSHGRCVPQ
jgi:ectoine hydroxylase-related dioxygenase (phytanoyl-CoA dioxygenase family)